MMWRIAIICLCCLAGLTGCQSDRTVVVQPSSDRGGQGLVLTGTATVRVKPTLVVLRLGVSFTDASPAVAKSQAEEAIGKVVAAVRSKGVSASDVQTTSFNLMWNEPRTRIHGGWRCATSLEIRVKNVDRAGAVLEAAMSAGANQVTSVEYTVEELQKVRAQARDEATKTVKAKADQYARNFGLKLGAPTHITESVPMGWSYASNSLSQTMMESRMDASDRSPDKILSSGSVAVTLTVHVTYALPQ
ncbi:MAG TPA: SIMPL domain-containing protein [Fimbriimonadaceae bacterium]|nr:SIMPL domain-containing protein [Fimbriimonadaceae bacterium]HRJ33747.1 SIMPL domain-containing protein [Fimbriimonadaceae bacterium]